MEISVLVDNNTIIDKYFKGEPGFSVHIKEANKNILFDLGYSDIFIENARQLNLNLNDIDYLVFSHGHIDHTGGLDPLIKYYFETGEHMGEKIPQIIAHPDCFANKYYGNNSSIGMNVDKEVVNNLFEVKKSKDPIWLTEKLLYLGEIPRENNFESDQPIGYQNEIKAGCEDYILDDTALAYKAKEGLIIITGCSHAGICNIVSQAKKITEVENVIDIIGGFHLMEPGKEKLEKTKKYLKNLNLSQLHACHCTDLKSKIELAQIADLQEVGAGMQFKFE